MKILLIGQPNCGKTELRRKYLGDSFDGLGKISFMETIGADFAVKEMDLFKSEKTKFQIWDITESKQFNNIRSLYYHGSHGAIVVFDVTKPETYSKCGYLIDELKQYLHPNPIPLILVGNNVNSRDSTNSKHITTEQGELLAKEISERYRNKNFISHVPYFETDPETGQNISAIFHTLAEFILRGQTSILAENSSFRIILNHLKSEKNQRRILSLKFKNQIFQLFEEILNELKGYLQNLQTIQQRLKKPIQTNSLMQINRYQKEIFLLDLKVGALTQKLGQTLFFKQVTKLDITPLVKPIKKELKIFNELSKTISNQLTDKLTMLDRLKVLSKFKKKFDYFDEQLDLNLKELNKIKSENAMVQSLKTIVSIKNKINSINLFEEFNSKIQDAIKLPYKEVKMKLEYLKVRAPLVEQKNIQTLSELKLKIEKRLKELTKKVTIHLETCLADRTIIPVDEINFAYYCNECQLYLCNYCQAIVLKTESKICPGSWKTKPHQIIV